MTQTPTNDTPNVNPAPVHVSREPMTQKELGIVITVAITGLLLQILTVWYWHKAPNVPAVEQTSPAVNTTNGALTTTM